LWIFVINAISFLLSAILECFINIPPRTGCQNQDNSSGIFKDMKQGYDYIFSNQSLVILLFIVMIIHFFVGSMEIFMPVLADEISRDGVKTLGFFHAAFGFGTILMAVVLSFHDISGKEKTTLFTSVFTIGLLYVAASCFKGDTMVLTVLFLGMIFLSGCCIICAGISFKTLLQKSIDNSFSGRVFAVAGSVGNASIPGAMIIYGILLEKITFQSLLLWSGLILMLISTILLMLYKEKKNVRTIEIDSRPIA
ncbi:MAG: MFS transporter, partial [Desulfobacula sp.]|nr:MFS transporter [Desulfobacula sp.]